MKDSFSHDLCTILYSPISWKSVRAHGQCDKLKNIADLTCLSLARGWILKSHRGAQPVVTLALWRICWKFIPNKCLRRKFGNTVLRTFNFYNNLANLHTITMKLCSAAILIAATAITSTVYAWDKDGKRETQNFQVALSFFFFWLTAPPFRPRNFPAERWTRKARGARSDILW